MLALLFQISILDFYIINFDPLYDIIFLEVILSNVCITRPERDIIDRDHFLYNCHLLVLMDKRSGVGNVR